MATTMGARPAVGGAVSSAPRDPRDQTVLGMALSIACRSGGLQVAMALARQYGLTAADVRAHGALRGACAGGHLAVAQWLAAAFGLGPADARESHGEAFHRACVNGHLATAQWLAAHFGLTAADARAYGDWLQTVAVAGNPEMTRWLAGRLGAPADEVASHAADGRTLAGTVAQNGHQAVAAWLAAAFGLVP